MKKFYYMVSGFEWEDTVAFGTAWAAAKAKAIELHAPIVRRIVKRDTEKYEAFAVGGCFVNVNLLDADSYKIW